MFTRLCPRLWLLRATSRQRVKHLFARCHSVAESPLPGGAGTGGAFRFGAGLLSPVVVKRAVPLLQNE
ncbi:MAG: hypothetical protein KJ070_19040, partial [Verrucomicrobia bacterium]|nr:hypothetical protein [Verrucomicrobiota bacterium]